MSATTIHLLMTCAHCGDGCERECAECRFLYCEAHVDPRTHACEAVCLELRRCEDEEASRGAQLVLFPTA